MNSCGGRSRAGAPRRCRLPGIVLALEQEPVQRRGQPLAGGAAVVGRVGFVRAGQRHARRMVQVLVEDAVQAVAAVRHRPHQPRVLRLVLGDDDHRSRRRRLAGDPRQRRQDVLGRDVEDLLRGVDAEAVDVELAHPVGDVRQHQLAHALAVRVVEVERLAPLVRVLAAGVPAARTAAGSCRTGRGGCRRRRGSRPGRARARCRRSAGDPPACRSRGTARTTARRRSPSRSCRRTPPPASSGSP